MSNILLRVLRLSALGNEVASRRKALRLTQSELAKKAGISRATLASLENGRCSELGFTKIRKLLAALGLELRVHEVISRRPTLDELMEENRRDQGLDQQR
jgi:transcriptional regulator with XRE-family HTH domain